MESGIMDGLWWSIVITSVVVAICGNEKKDGEFYEQFFLDTTTNPISIYL
jgi:hypothetical protein